MPSSEGPYRVGQEVEVSYRARVEEVGTGHLDGFVRLGTAAGTTGWVRPSREEFTVTVVREPLPEKPGLYRMKADDPKQAHMGLWHSDGYEFHYLNTQNNWVDIGYGTPSMNDGLKLEGPLVLPTELGDPLSPGEKGMKR